MHRLTAALADRYRVERELGRGGMATVYLAEDLKHARRVAIKALRAELAAALGPERFLREIRLTAQLDHPHILPLLDSGEADGVLYYVMPYVEGESLRDRLTREKQLPLDDAVQIAREVADALNYAHSHGVVHRDIKPENVLLAGRHARVADFGIARAVTVAGGEALTDTGLAIGTPAYMSPEQAGGKRDVDGRSDLYSLGCVLYEMLAGHPPFTGATAQEVLARHSLDAVPRVSAARPSVSAALERAIASALAKTPADRFSTAAQFAEALLQREPEGMPSAALARRKARLAQLGVTAVVVVAGALLLLRSRQGVVEPAYDRTAIAVLPFQNLSADGPHGYFAGGLQDELLTQLSKIGSLKVISRTSVMGYAGSSTPPLRQIARELGVGSVVEGSVQVVGMRLRVNVQLIDANTDAHLWAERYERTLDDAFVIQSDVAQQIVTAVGAALTSADQGRLSAAPTANSEAYRLYLQGREYYVRDVNPQDWQRAQQLYEHALALDPEFALAHAALSEVHGRMYWLRFDPSPVRVTRQREEAEAALRLAPDLPQAHVAMGLVYSWGGRDDRRALEEFAIALKDLPNDAELWFRIAGRHRLLGNWDASLSAFAKATELNPRAAYYFSQLGWTQREMRRFDDALRAYDRALSLAPDLQIAAVERAEMYVVWQGQLDTLRAVLSRLPTEAGLGAFGSRPLQLQLLYWERLADSLLRALPKTGMLVFEGQNYFLPRSLYAAWAHQLRGDVPAALGAFDSARLLLDSVLQELPDDWRVHAALGLAVAGLGRRQEALQEVRWLENSVPQDAPVHRAFAEERAQILVHVGESDAALDEIEPILAAPSRITTHTLRLDPVWDPIRDHPRFKALLVKY